MCQQQLELALEGSAQFRPLARTQRANRARWWFQQMHQLVDRAMDWQTGSNARPAQTHFSLAHGR